MTNIIDNFVNESLIKFLPIEPESYHEIDADNKIDFINDILPGTNIGFTIEKFKHKLSVSRGVKPNFYQVDLLNKSLKNHNFGVSVYDGKDIQLNYIMKPIKGIGADFSVNTSIGSKRLSGTFAAYHRGKRSFTEIKGTEIGDHRLVGVSYSHIVRSWWTLGAEAYYKFIQSSGGAGLASRFRGELAGLQYTVTSSYNIMGDLQLGTSICISPKYLSISSRFNLNTNSMQSNTQFGAKLMLYPTINGYSAPTCLKIRTSNNLENAISLEVHTPAVKISLGCFGKKLDLFNNIGINFEI
ncbi:hypothetical protein DICPUDRAFT_152275 [Dictyostelium purpureum]|uniref:Uncharacterized protein n=1 Tax=Dictyostelium purpureum TaxID=5786 RepID=F0ZKX7_DICPU|nr:uncharacterized protein DICPUDRAFT_152275 [Dictyostelium purpureum]EGC35391.1 hypothetical protein DICPUDRAFT_152275 [Dictyostelium purpureum]|eukprot:XP_003288067.1 hypothetical protein DICPUDRAFT_152275 [Dictyostelium purpureum]